MSYPEVLPQSSDHLLTRTETLRITALSIAIAASPMIGLRTEECTQAQLFSRAKDVEIFIKSARDDA